MTDGQETVGPIAFIGLGMMGLPMASRLVAKGFAVRGCDASKQAREAFAASGGEACALVGEAVAGASIVITMLPDGKIVRDVLLGAASQMQSGALVVDMSSSAPLGTRALAKELRARGFRLVDVPVSGGVARAKNGTLAIMAGGAGADIEHVRPLLLAMGSTVTAVGQVGAGHAVKALNNFVSACGLVAACEATLVAEKFDIDPATLIDVFNQSTGRNNSTESKMKPQVLSGAFASGFAMALMAKDLRTAAELAEALEVETPGPREMAELWTQASAALGSKADHTEIHRFLAGERHPRNLQPGA